VLFPLRGVSQPGNFWLLLNDTDLGNQLQWWRGVMAQAQANNERVYVIAHLAPAGKGFFKDFITLCAPAVWNSRS